MSLDRMNMLALTKTNEQCICYDDHNIITPMFNLYNYSRQCQILALFHHIHFVGVLFLSAVIVVLSVLCHHQDHYQHSWWRHQMETFSALLAICAGNSPVPGEFPAQRSVTRSFDVFFDLRLNKRLSKQSWGWWFETLLRSLWRHRNVSRRNSSISSRSSSSTIKFIIVVIVIMIHLNGYITIP